MKFKSIFIYFINKILRKFYYTLLLRFYFFVDGPEGLSFLIKKMPKDELVISFLLKYGAKIHPTSRIRKGIDIHNPSNSRYPFKNLSIEENAYIDKNVFIDLSEKVKIGKNTRISSSVMIYTHLASHNRGSNEINLIQKPVIIGNNSRIYPATIITAGVTIGDNVLVGANSFIKNNSLLRSNSLYAGNPVQLIKKFN